MAFQNAFQGGQQFAVLLDRQKQQRDAEALRQQGIEALGEEFGPTAFAPAAEAQVRGTRRAERAQEGVEAQRITANELAERRQTGAEEQREIANIRADRTLTGAEEQRAIANIRADRTLTGVEGQREIANIRSDRALDAADAQRVIANQRQAEQAAAKDADRRQVNQARALGNFVNFARAALKRGKTIEEITETQSQVLTALGVSPDQQELFTQAFNDDPRVLDQFAASLDVQAQPNRVLSTKTFRKPDGTTAEFSIMSKGPPVEITVGVPVAAVQAGERIDISKERAKIAAEAVRLKTPEVAADKALSVEAAKQAVKTLAEDFPTATAAANGVRSADISLRLLDEGIRTGSLGAARQGAARFFQDILGLDDDQVAPTDEFFARAGIAVAQQIQAFGAGTGLSDADRDFARGIVGGDIALDEKAIRRLLKARRDIDLTTVKNFNKRLGRVSGTTSEATRARLPASVPLPGAEVSLEDLLNKFAPAG